MSKIRPNDRCPCGSGIKYKRCCMGLPGERESLPPNARRIELGGQRLTASAGVDDSDLHAAAAWFNRKDERRGFAQDLADFAAPLLQAADTPEKQEKALSLGAIFWNLALVADNDERRRAFEEVIDPLSLAQPERVELWDLAQDMVERRREMFPDLHREPSR